MPQSGGGGDGGGGGGDGGGGDGGGGGIGGGEGGTIFREAKISKLRARYKLPASSHACQLHLRTLSATVECAAVKTGVGQKCHPYQPPRAGPVLAGSRVFHLSSHAATPTQTAKDDGPDAFHLHIYRTGIGRACNLLSRIILHEQDHEVRGLECDSWWVIASYEQLPRGDCLHF